MFKQDPDAAMVAAHEAKWLAKETLEKVMWSVAEVCGSTSAAQPVRPEASVPWLGQNPQLLLVIRLMRQSSSQKKGYHHEVFHPLTLA
jgi:hypothetical protein